MGSRCAVEVDARLGAAVKKCRRSAGVSQERFGEAIGVTYQQVQKYENGRDRIAVSQLVAMGAALKISACEFLHLAGLCGTPGDAFQATDMQLVALAELWPRIPVEVQGQLLSLARAVASA